MKRPTLDQYLMGLALVASTRTTCLRKGVGCVLADERGRVLAVNYNGVASGLPHCNESSQQPVYHDDPRVKLDRRKHEWIFNGQRTPIFANLDASIGDKQCVGFDTVYAHACEGHDRPAGEPTSCGAVHAEQNAIVACADPDRIVTAYITTAPCRPCVKLLLNTGCRRIVWHEPHHEMEEARELWVEKAGREWVQLKD